MEEITSENRFKCHICLETFKLRTTLLRHFLRIHTGDKPFKCDICTKAFSRKDKLVLHKIIHPGYKPYSCPICKRTFSLNENLQKHMRIRRAEKPVCKNICETSFEINTLNDPLTSESQEETLQQDNFASTSQIVDDEEMICQPQFFGGKHIP